MSLNPDDLADDLADYNLVSFLLFLLSHSQLQFLVSPYCRHNLVKSGSFSIPVVSYTFKTLTSRCYDGVTTVSRILMDLADANVPVWC